MKAQILEEYSSALNCEVRLHKFFLAAGRCGDMHYVGGSLHNSNTIDVYINIYINLSIYEVTINHKDDKRKLVKCKFSFYFYNIFLLCVLLTKLISHNSIEI